MTTGNLLVSVLDLYGIKKDKQGDSTGPPRRSCVVGRDRNDGCMTIRDRSPV